MLSKHPMQRGADLFRRFVTKKSQSSLNHSKCPLAVDQHVKETRPRVVSELAIFKRVRVLCL